LSVVHIAIIKSLWQASAMHDKYNCISSEVHQRLRLTLQRGNPSDKLEANLWDRHGQKKKKF